MIYRKYILQAVIWYTYRETKFSNDLQEYNYGGFLATQ